MAKQIEISEELEQGNIPRSPGRPDDIGPFGSDSPFYKTLQGTPIQGLIASATGEKAFQMDTITHTGTAKSEGVIIIVDEEAILDLSGQTFKVLIMVLSVATAQLPREDKITADAIQRGRIVRISLEDYMRACKIKDRKTAREQLNTAIFALYGVSLEWYETEWAIPEGKSRKVKTKAHHRMRITDHTITREEGNPVKNNVAEIRLSFDMAEYLSGAYIMPYPAALLTINTKNNPYSIPLGWKLCALDNTNITNNNPERVGRTTVQTLLRAAQGIPRYEAIASTGQVYNRIIAPFNRDLQELVYKGVLRYCYYETPLGERIEGDQLGGLSYQEFSSLSVCYEITGYPDQTPRIEAKQKRISAAISRNQRAARKRKEAEKKAKQ